MFERYGRLHVHSNGYEKKNHQTNYFKKSNGVCQVGEMAHI